MDPGGGKIAASAHAASTGLYAGQRLWAMKA
jgi:hypothetical protein